jgi:cytoskeleton protein RodZ
MSEQKDSQTIVGAGKVFAEGREALDLTREQTADILNLSVRTVRALEESKPDQLPDKVYVNGYIRSYAKLLGLAAQPLIDAWWAQHAERANDSNTAEPMLDRASGEERAQPFKMGRWTALALVISVGFVYFVTNSDQGVVEEVVSETPQQALTMAVAEQGTVPGDPSPAYPSENSRGVDDPVVSELVDDGGIQEAAEEAVSELIAAEITVAAAGQVPTDQASSAPQSNRGSQQQVIAAAGESTLAGTARSQVVEDAGPIASESASEEQSRGQSLAAANQGETLGQQEADSVSLEQPLAASAESNATADSVQEEAALVEREVPTAYALPRLTALGDDEIQLSFTLDCWFELRDEAGVLLYADLGRAGQARRYIGAGPFRIKFGYSPGVTLIFNDSEVDLRPFSRRDVANLVVGADAQSGSVSASSPPT